jgi:predicted alpha/beta-hydrolase family hydrolase
MDSPFMEFFAKGLGKQGFRVVRFEYPYMDMAAKPVTGKRTARGAEGAAGRGGAYGTPD